MQYTYNYLAGTRQIWICSLVWIRKFDMLCQIRLVCHGVKKSHYLFFLKFKKYLFGNMLWILTLYKLTCELFHWWSQSSDLLGFQIYWWCIFEEGWVQQGTFIYQVPTPGTFQKANIELRTINFSAPAAASWSIYYICLWWPLGALKQSKCSWYSSKSSTQCEQHISWCQKLFIFIYFLLFVTCSLSIIHV